MKTVLKLCNAIGKILATHKDSVQAIKRQRAVYQVPSHECDFSYNGETKRCFTIRTENI